MGALSSGVNLSTESTSDVPEQSEMIVGFKLQ